MNRFTTTVIFIGQADTCKHVRKDDNWKMSDQDKQTIMIVEDDELLRSLFAPLFVQKGMEVVLADDGQDAIEKSRLIPPPTLVILDLMMPHVDGFGVLTAFKQDPLWKDVPVVIFTNLGDESDRAKAKELGADEYIIKSAVSLGELVESVDGVIAKHKKSDSVVRSSPQ